MRVPARAERLAAVAGLARLLALVELAREVKVFLCGGRLRLIATVHDPAVIRKILAHLALCHSGQSPGLAPPESSAAAS
jgi:hypothetical protein